MACHLHFIFYTCVVPIPYVSVIANNDMIVGQPFSLECIMTTVRGINSQINIIWSKVSNGEELKRENVSAYMIVNSSVMYRDYLNISQLTTDDNGETYMCEVIINTSSPVKASDSFTLYVTGKNLQQYFMLHIHTYVRLCLQFQVSQLLLHQVVQFEELWLVTIKSSIVQ